MTHTIRATRAEDWKRAREIRLDALRDEVAHLAFLETYGDAAAKPDSFWQGRTDGVAEGRDARQFVAEQPDGRWLGTLTVLVERPGTDGVFGAPVEVPQTHVVGVFVSPEARGTGLAAELLHAGVEWSWALAEPRVARVRLWVHEDNDRAEALYAKAGFTRTGASAPVPGDDSRREHELALPRPATTEAALRDRRARAVERLGEMADQGDFDEFLGDKGSYRSPTPPGTVVRNSATQERRSRPTTGLPPMPLGLGRGTRT